MKAFGTGWPRLGEGDATGMDAGLLLLTILSAVLGALAAALAGAPLPFTMLAYSASGTVGLLAVATWRGLHVAGCETAGRRFRP
jgi:energy-converting hydrogenase Eha subunit C